MIDLGQETLFGKKVISSINYNEDELIKDILFLHSSNNAIDVDPCYSVGNFYKNGIPQPTYKFDKFPQTKDTVYAESHSLPLHDDSVNTIMFDPPFVIGGLDNPDVKEGSNIISRRFTNFQSFDELKKMYATSLSEFYRILKNEGIVMFKCQDVVASAKQHFSHVWIMQQAISIGFYPKDLFILLSKNRIVDGRKQQHARKFHSYYWVFKKIKCNVNYKLYGF